MSLPTFAQLQRALHISELIEKLQSEFSAIFGGSSAPTKATRGSKRKGKRTMSPEARERIAAAQRARWAKAKGGSTAKKEKPVKSGKKKRVVSPEARARMAEAAKKRWAARKA
jgi:hypothetical protein